MEISHQYQPDDEIDLFELFSSLFQQWRLIVGITVLGVVLSVVIALLIPNQYELTAQVALPDLSDVMTVTNKGYSERDTGRDTGRDAERLFQRYYNMLRSPVHFNRFVKQGEWLKRIYSSKVTENNRNYLLSKLRSDVDISIVSPKQPKNGKGLPPRVLGVTLIGVDEVLTAEFVNQYIEYTGDSLLDKIKQDGKKSAVAEIEKIQADMAALRYEAKVGREAELVRLEEALALAKKIGIKKPDSIRLYSQSNQRSINGLTSELSDDTKGLFLMGSEYLKGEINNLTTRKNDDPYISDLLPSLKRIKQLESLSFDFAGVKLYTLDQQAVTDDQAEKPKRALIVAVGSVLSLFVGVFVALFAGAVKRRKTVVV